MRIPSLELHNKAIGAELAKAKPRDSVLLPLMRSTYGVRRMFILNEAKCVQGILEKLARPGMVSTSALYYCKQAQL